MSEQMALDSMAVIRALRKKGYSLEEAREVLKLAVKRLEVEGLRL